MIILGITHVRPQNIHKVTKALGIDLYTYVVDNKEADDIYRATFMQVSQNGTALRI